MKESPDQKIRLSKIMADRNICSRREADDLISKGSVLVDGEIAKELGVKFPNTVTISLTKQAQDTLNKKMTILINKPIGFVSSQAEKGYKPAVRLIKTSTKDPRCKTKLKKEHLNGLAPAGRLDIDSTGLLILTQDGVVAKKIISKESEIEKEYIVKFKGVLTEEKLGKLNYGLSLDGKKLKPAKVGVIEGQENQLRFILKEGKKRQIRRVCECVDLKVTYLKRIRIGNIQLGHLKPGSWRFLDPNHEIKNL